MLENKLNLIKTKENGMVNTVKHTVLVLDIIKSNFNFRMRWVGFNKIVSEKEKCSIWLLRTNLQTKTLQ